MFKKLKIQNYILINQLDIEFEKGLNIITGETGAGKSVLLGALAVLLGQRADFSVIKDKNSKCLIEGELDFKSPSILQFFKQHDIEEEFPIIIRREILSSGRSRAFINDTPVKLKDLEQFAFLAFDFHSQHENLMIKDESFRLQLIDSIAANKKKLEQYQKALKDYNEQLDALKKKQRENEKVAQEIDFLQFQFDALQQAQLQPDELETLEEEYEVLNHTEEIKKAKNASFFLLTEDERSVSGLLYEVEQQIKSILKYDKKAEGLLQRIESNRIDLEDISSDIEVQAEAMVYEPERLIYIDERLALLNDLLRKHKVETVNELIDLRNELDERLQSFNNFDFEIKEAENQLKEKEQILQKAASELSLSREKVLPLIEQKINESLLKLGMPKAEFFPQVKKTSDFGMFGTDQIAFLFSANQGLNKEDISKVASGGEISRLMLALKHLLSQSTGLSTLILDEIDTGVSGEIASKMGRLMQEMAEHRQVITITHLPQIAAQGKVHFKVYKQNDSQSTITQVKRLDKQERVYAIAELLSGENLTDAAIKNAEELLS